MAELGGSKLFEDKERFIERIEKFRRANDALVAENSVFDTYISRLDPRFFESHEESDGIGYTGPSRVRKTTRAHVLTHEKLQRLTLKQKCDIANKEMEDKKEDLESLKKTSERTIFNLQAILEEADVRLVDVRKASHEFDHDVARVLQGKTGAITGAERVTQYFLAKIRAKNKLVERLRLRRAALRVQKAKVFEQLSQKEMMGEGLQEVDLHQLKIQNRQLREDLDKSHDLQRLKQLAGDSQRKLNLYKKKLQDMTSESNKLIRDIASRQDMLRKIEKQRVKSEEECVKADILRRKLKYQQEDVSVPASLDYIKHVAYLDQLRKNVQAWERKVGIAEMAVKTQAAAYDQMVKDVESGPSPQGIPFAFTMEPKTNSL